MATARAEHYVHSEENVIDFVELTPQRCVGQVIMLLISSYKIVEYLTPLSVTSSTLKFGQLKAKWYQSCTHTDLKDLDFACNTWKCNLYTVIVQ